MSTSKSYLKIIIRTSVCLILSLTILVFGDGGNGQSHAQDLKMQKVGEGPSTIDVISRTEMIRMTTNVPSDITKIPGFSPFQGYGSFPVTVQSTLPAWGSALSLIFLEGPSGILPPNRLWVRTEKTGTEFVPLDHPVPIVSGDFRLPVKETTVELLFRPKWSDPAGMYSGRLMIQPYVPEVVSSVEHETTSIHLLGGSKDGPELEFGNPDGILISLVTDQVNFNTGLGPGTYNADEDVIFYISSNSECWRVDCSVESLVSDEDEIPLQRLLWERLDASGNVIDNGDMRTSQTVIMDCKPVEEMEVTVRFKLTTTMDDIAGVYHGQLSVVGYVGQ